MGILSKQICIHVIQEIFLHIYFEVYAKQRNSWDILHTLQNIMAEPGNFENIWGPQGKT